MQNFREVIDIIIYFSATGNSKYVAKRIKKPDKSLIFIPEAADNGIFELEIADGESLGIVSPTYNWTLPSIVTQYLERVHLKFDKKPYTYYIGTFGTTTGSAARFAEDLMKASGCEVDAFYDIKMPDTWTPIFNLSDKELVKSINEKADSQLDLVKNMIERKARGRHLHTTLPYFVGKAGKAIYDGKTRKTNNFTVEEGCIGCGLCARKCPVHAIEMQNKRPVWAQDKCAMCLGCLHRCPKFAIQYGRSTKNHGQYIHPNK